MRHGVFYPTLPPSPPPSAVSSGGGSVEASKMVASVLMALLLPCAGMSFIFMIYIYLLWYTSRRARNNQNDNNSDYREPVKPVARHGLTETELERLPEVTAEELKKIGRTECAVCLEEIDYGQPARLLPECGHGFHLPCADTWLSRNFVCPLCRAVIHVT